MKTEKEELKLEVGTKGENILTPFPKRRLSAHHLAETEDVGGAED